MSGERDLWKSAENILLPRSALGRVFIELKPSELMWNTAHFKDGILQGAKVALLAVCLPAIKTPEVAIEISLLKLHANVFCEIPLDDLVPK